MVMIPLNPPCILTTPSPHRGASDSLENTVVPHDRPLTLAKDKEGLRHAWKVPEKSITSLSLRLLYLNGYIIIFQFRARVCICMTHSGPHISYCHTLCACVCVCVTALPSVTCNNEKAFVRVCQRGNRNGCDLHQIGKM